MGEGRGAGVDAGEPALATAKAPAHHPHLDPGVVHFAGEGTARGVLQGREGQVSDGGSSMSGLSLGCPGDET